jgi:hypothetical protein
MPIDKEELRQDREIDPAHLDVELLRNPGLYLKWAAAATEAKWEADNADLAVDVGLARLELDIRKNPQKYNIPNLTEASVKAAIKLTPEYTRLVQVANTSKRDAALMGQAVAAIAMKKSALRELVTLHGQGYFAGPDVPHNLTELWRKQYGGYEGNKPETRQKARLRKKPSDPAEPA